MAVDLVNQFASGYQVGSAIQQAEKVKTEAEEVKNIFSDVMKNKDKFGGDEGAFREAARRFGESGNIAGFNMAQQEATGFRQMKEAKKQEAMQHLGAAAMFLYGRPEAEKKEAYQKIKDNYAKMGIDTSDWPDKENYTDEWGLSTTGTKESAKFFDSITYKPAMAEAAGKKAEAAQTTAEAAKIRAAKSGAGGKGGTAERHIQIAEYMTGNKIINPATKKPYTKGEALEASRLFVDAAKHKTRSQWISDYVAKGGSYKRAKELANQLFTEETDSEESAPRAKGGADPLGLGL